MGDNDFKQVETERLAAILAEQFESQLATAVENFDDRIKYHLAPIKSSVANLESDMSTVKLVLTDTSKDVRKLQINADKTNKHLRALGQSVKKIGDRLDKSIESNETSFSDVREETRLLSARADEHDLRLNILEKAT